MRKKPVPPPGDKLIELLAEYDIAVGELALALRLIMLEEAPTATETVFKGYALSLIYSLSGKWADAFCYIGVYTRHVNLGFNWGSKLRDPDGLLAGSGKYFRHIKVARPEDLEQPYLRSFIRAALKHVEADRAKRATKPSTDSKRRGGGKSTPVKGRSTQQRQGGQR